MTMLSNFNFKIDDLKKIMPGETAFKFAEKYCVNLTRKKITKKNPVGALKNPYEDILRQQWSPRTFCDLCVDFVTSGDGKYVKDLINGEKAESIDEAIHYRDVMLSSLESYHNLLRKKFCEDGYNKIHHIHDDDRDICLPDAFSDSIVKPLMRKNLQFQAGSDDSNRVSECISRLARIHELERSVAQIAGDIAELRLLKSNKNDVVTLIFPTFTHKAGDDFLCYDNVSKSFSGQDAKTSRWPKHFSDETKFDDPMPTRKEAMSRPEKALRRLYEKQGEDRFSSKPRLLLVRTPPGESPSTVDSIRDQFSRHHNITFVYKREGKVAEYNVMGAKIIFF